MAKTSNVLYVNKCNGAFKYVSRTSTVTTAVEDTFCDNNINCQGNQGLIFFCESSVDDSHAVSSPIILLKRK